MVFHTHGGKRKRAGRKAGAHRVGFERHASRPAHDRRDPVHVTMRAVSTCPRFREERVFRAIRARLAKAARDGFRIIHFSVQNNHLHLIVEAADRVSLWRGIQRLAQRIAWDMNTMFRRHGPLWRDRYTRRDLTSLRQVRNALVYVTMNFRKHARGRAELEQHLATLDTRSSAAWLDGWDPRAGPMLVTLREDLADGGLADCPVSPPRTWSARVGWKQHGLVLPTEHPKGV
jgi:putative transposase